jgi:hypothetical protein
MMLIEMRLEIVDASVDDPGRVEDAVAAMHHVIVERDHHQRGICDDATELARVEGVELNRLPPAELVERGENVSRRQQPGHVCGGAHWTTVRQASGIRPSAFVKAPARQAGRDRDRDRESGTVQGAGSRHQASDRFSLLGVRPRDSGLEQDRDINSRSAAR